MTKLIKGCTVDLFETVDQKSDNCVLDTGDYVDCVYANIIVRENGDPREIDISTLKSKCQYWCPGQRAIKAKFKSNGIQIDMITSDGEFLWGHKTENAKDIQDAFYDFLRFLKIDRTNINRNNMDIKDD